MSPAYFTPWAPWGTRDGKEVRLYTLTAAAGATCQVCTYGATLVSLRVPDQKGTLDDVMLGFDDLASYEKHGTYIGCAVGRTCSRISNARFTLEGQVYQLPANNATACHHGGPVGFNQYVWDVVESTSRSVTLRHVSPHLDQGYPGQLTATVKYELLETSDDGVALAAHFSAECDRATVVNLTNHAYFNLAGVGEATARTMYDHVVSINADTFVPVDEGNIPLGHLRYVQGSPFDFRTPTSIGKRIEDDDTQLRIAAGYDHNMVLRHSTDLPPGATGGTRGLGLEVSGAGDSRRALRTRKPDAVAEEPTTGRRLEMFTTEPAVHFYTGNYLGNDPIGKMGKPIERRAGFCFETQHLTDSPNQPSFPSVVLQPGKTWETSTVFWLTTIGRHDSAKGTSSGASSGCGGCFAFLAGGSSRT